ncbi:MULTISPECIES: hypothetical protein [unclassified Iodidimonas]|jgi:hypothetical protein|uniref:hypothetical protein n=1 Tax=unclassified Iodidimonas TaxID=2626145 RepID=UPI00248235BA|nr:MULTISPECIES: hypothetical protein [unclassified Iodidimonas]
MPDNHEAAQNKSRSRQRFSSLFILSRQCVKDIKRRLPRSRPQRIVLGILLLLGGTMGFLPVLGFWMLPLGVIVLSMDLHPVRRLSRRFSLWYGRRARDRS